MTGWLINSQLLRYQVCCFENGVVGSIILAGKRKIPGARGQRPRINEFVSL